MDRKLKTLLGVETGGLGVADMAIRKWGMEVELTFMLNPPDRSKMFTLTFEDCEELEFSTSYDDDFVAEEAHLFEADVIGLVTGEEGHQQPAKIACDVFGMKLSYGKLRLEKHW